MILLNFDAGKITKQSILEKVSEEEIYTYYIGEKCLNNKNIKSPLREEKNPSFGIYYSTNCLKWKDFGTGESGDVFNLIQSMYRLSFIEALQKINSDLILNLGSSDLRILRTKTKNKKIRSSEISITQQPYTFTDITYWKSFGISLKTLIKYNIKSVKEAWIDNEFYSSYTHTNPIYAFIFCNNIKLYMPFADTKYKWRYDGNKDIIAGYEQLKLKGNIVILTKSLKDVALLDELGYDAISLQGETVYLEELLVQKLLARYNKIILFYDNDVAGKSASSKIALRYSFKQIFIPDRFNKKDISDYYKRYGKYETKKLLKILLYE